LAAEPPAGAAAAGREEPADLRVDLDLDHDYDNDHDYERDDYDEDGNADCCQRW
jgi:hypothetical protein